MKPAIPASHLYCTYLDSAYLARGIAMLDSLCRYDATADILALALDELCANVLRQRYVKRVRVIETETIHAFEPRLRDIRRQRSAWAYYATQKPALARFAMESGPPPESLMYIDADTWFFSDPSAMFEEIGGASVGLSPNRFHTATEHLAIYGLYGAGCVYWRNDETGRRCVDDWREDCLNWCGEQPQPDGRFMNQGYLTRWPERYPSVHVMQQPGSNLGPWNVDGHELAREHGNVTVDGQPLIFYHFSGLNRDADGQWYSFYPHLDRHFELACQWIYRPYLIAIEKESRRLKEEAGIDGAGTVREISQWPAAVRFGCELFAKE